MSRNGSGTYTLPAGNPVVTGTTISTTWANNTLNDIAATLTDSVAADGQTPMTGNLNLSNNRIVNVTDPTLAQDAATKAYTDAKTNGTSAGSFTTVTTGAGTVSAPSITTTGDTNTGIFFPAADTIAFTEGGVEAMRINSAGNVGIGTSPDEILDIYKNGVAISKIRGGSATGQGAGYYVWKTDNSASLCAFGDYANQLGGTPNTLASIYTAGGVPLVFAASGSEKMRISSAGFVGIGTNNPNFPLDIVTSATVGTTCISISSGNSSSQCAQIKMENTYSGVPTPQKFLRISNQGYFEIVNSVYSNTIFQLTDSGNAYNTNGTWGSLSDARVKDNIEPARNYLSDLCRLRVVKYSLKSEESKVPTKLGFVAQEVEQVFPNMVESSKDSFSGLDDLKQIKLSVLTPMLVKAVQELKAELDSVKSELAALKA